MDLGARLRTHPFGVRARLEQSVVLTYAVPAIQLQALLPPPLRLDVAEATPELGYVAVALVRARDLRPGSLPRVMGKSFFLAGYRVFVRYEDVRGRRLRGLYILGSATDSPIMARLGGLMTDYRYRVIDVEEDVRPGSYAVRSERGGLDVSVAWRAGGGAAEAALPEGSPFADWRAARRFAGPLPFTFGYDATRGRVIVVEGVREDWTPAPVSVWRSEVEYLRGGAFAGARLAAAFRVQDVPYRWKAGYTEPWPR